MDSVVEVVRDLEESEIEAVMGMNVLLAPRELPKEELAALMLERGIDPERPAFMSVPLVPSEDGTTMVVGRGVLYMQVPV